MPTDETPALLERDEPLAWMQGALREAREGHGHTFLIGGEAGIGKTSLLESFTHTNEGSARVLWGACESLTTPRPLGPLNDIAGELGGELLGAFRASRPPHELFQSFLHQLRTDGHPSIVVVEDAHWADDASADFMKFVARRIARCSALLAVTYREEEVSARHPVMRAMADVPADHLTRIHLRGLSPTSVERLAEAHGRRIPNLHVITEGNPLLVTELLRGHEEGLPATLRYTVLARVERLSAMAQELARFVAVVPDRCERTLIDRAFDASGEALRECLDYRVLVVDRESVRYRHELARHVVEDALADSERRALNARALTLLADLPRDAKTLSRLTHHADAASDAASVLRYSPLAGEEAAKRGAHSQAAAFYRSAIRYADRLEARDRANLLENLAGEAFSCNLKDEALRANDEAFLLWEQVGDTFAQGRNRRTHFDFSEYMSYSDDRTKFAGALETALHLLEPHGPSSDLAMAYSSYAFLLSIRGRHDEAEGYQNRAMKMAEALGEPSALTHVLLLGERRQNSFFGAPSFERTNRAIRIALGAGLDTLAAQGHFFRAIFAVTTGDYRGFDQNWTESIKFVEARDFEGQRLILQAVKAREELQHGDWDAALRRSMDLQKEPELPALADFFASYVPGLILFRRGEAGGRELLERAIQVAVSRIVAPVTRSFAHTLSAEAAWISGDQVRMLEHAGQAYDAAVITRPPLHLARAAYWLWRASALGTPPEDIFPPFKMQLNGDWAGAAAAWAELGCPYERALALIDGDEAAQREAFSILEKLGATAVIRRCREMLTERGVQRIPRGPRPSTRGNPMGLTDREIEILGLLAEGLGNAQISARLHRSVKTIGHHVSSILAKIGAGTRQEAVHIARSKGLLDSRR
jgi:DNA-binding CsgD family transcriptional regulator/tetratricopeptide (TPR) repeat protein